MARLLTGGFETRLLVTTAARDPEAALFTTSGTVTLDTTNPRSGAACASMGPSAANFVAYSTTGFAVLDRTYFFRHAFRFSQVTSAAGLHVLDIRDTTGIVASLFTTLGGKVNLRDEVAAVNLETSVPTLSATTWYVFEIAVKVPTAGNNTLSARILAHDGTLVHEFATYSVAGRNAAINNVRSGHISAGETAITVLMDDIGVNDDQGSNQNGYCGPGRVWLATPVADSAVGTGWLNGAGGTPVWDSANNTPPVGVLTPAAGTQAQNATSISGTSNLDLSVADYTTVGVPSTDRIVLTRGLFRIAGSSTTGTNDALARVVSNPADAGDTTFTAGFDIVAGAETATPTGWTSWFTPIVYSPSVTRGTRPVLRLVKNTAATRNHMCDLMGLLIESAPPFKRGVTPATETGAAVNPGHSKVMAATPGTETDASQAQSMKKRVANQTSLESDAALAALLKLMSAVHRGVETDAAVNPGFTQGSPHVIAPAAATEADATVNPGTKKRLSATNGAETDLALARTLMKLRPLTINRGVETDVVSTSTHPRKLPAPVAAAETDTAVKLLRLNYFVTPAAESDAAIAVALRKLSSGAHRGAETDVALGTAAYRRSVTPGTEADAAVAVARVKRVAATAGVESNAAQIAHALKQMSAAHRGAETDAAVAISYVKQIFVTAVPGTETDAAIAVALRKRMANNPGTESDLARTLTIVKRAPLTVNRGVETDVAVAVTEHRVFTVVPATTTDAAIAVVLKKRVHDTPALETDVAIQLVLKARINPALETDAAVAAHVRKRLVNNIATSTSVAVAVLIRKLVAHGLGTETDAAVAVTYTAPGQHIGVTAAIEADAAVARARLKLKHMVAALDPNVAVARAHRKFRVVVPATEHDLATIKWRGRWVPAIELDVAPVVFWFFPGNPPPVLEGPTGGQADILLRGGEVDALITGGDAVLAVVIGGQVYDVPTGGATVIIPVGGQVDQHPSGGDVDLKASGGQIERQPTGGLVFDVITGGEVEAVEPLGGEVTVVPTGGEVVEAATGGETEVFVTGGQVHLPAPTGGDPDEAPKTGGQVEVKRTGGQTRI